MEFEITKSKLAGVIMVMIAILVGAAFKDDVHVSVIHFMVSGFVLVCFPELIGAIWGMRRAARGISDSTSSPGCIVSICGWFLMGMGMLILLLS